MINDIIDLTNRGEVARDEFIQQFTKNDSKLKYYDPIKRNQLKLLKKKQYQKMKANLSQKPLQLLIKRSLIYSN